MSKIGKLPVTIVEGVTLTKEDHTVKVTGPKGFLELKLPKKIELKIEDGKAEFFTKDNSDTARALWGTYRALLANAVKGVSEGWSKQLEIVGTGYRAETNGKKLTLTVGYSHPVDIEASDGISFKVEKMIITVEGIDKELVGLYSARIRGVRPPEPYKGKGIKYINEVIRRKAGKAAKAQA